MNTKTPEIQHTTLSLQSTIAIKIIAIVIIVVAVIGSVIYLTVRQNLDDQFSKRVLNLAALARPEDLHSILKNFDNKNLQKYNKISQGNLAILNSAPVIGSIHIIQQAKKKNIYFVVYSLYEQGRAYTSLSKVSKNARPILINTLNTSKTEINIHPNQWGNWLSAYTSFYSNDDKTRKGTIEIDINKDAFLIASENNIIILIVGLFILFIIIILAILGWIISVRLTTPIVNMTKTILSISTENFDQRITTSSDGKEIDHLGQAINSMLVKIGSSFYGIKDRLSESAVKLDEQTQELEKIRGDKEKQAKQLKALAFVARATLSIPNLDNLLPRIVTVVSDTLSFYHIGIFLLDDAKEYAILTATNSVGGQKMIERNHRLKVGEEGIVGYAAGVARPRIALDIDKDAVFLTNHYLPETRSELAMPLKIGLNVIGVFDVQSTELSAFTEEDIEVFSVLADYISIAIQNAKRFQEIQKTITESDTLYRNYLRQEWKSFANQRRNLGYLYNISGSKPIIKKSESVEIQKAIQSGKPSISQEKMQSHLSVPIKLRGQVIGILNIQSGSNHAWEEDEIDIATAVADRVGLAVENARLLEDSQSRAARERTISEITSKIGASINIRNVLQTAVEELGHILPGSDVIIQLKNTKDKD